MHYDSKFSNMWPIELLYSQLFLVRFSNFFAKIITKIWRSAKNQDYEIANQFFAVDLNNSKYCNQIGLKYNWDSIMK